MTGDCLPQFLNGKWLAQAPSGTQRYATEAVKAAIRTRPPQRLTLVLPRDATVPAWARELPVIRSRLRGTLFEQLALPWISRHGHLYSLAGPAPLARRNQTVVMHDATPFRYPATFRRSFVLWYRLLYRVLSRRADRLLTVSDFSRRELADVLGIHPESIDLAPCGADHVPGAEEAVVELPFARQTYALLVGNLAPHKNIAAALERLSEAGVPTVVVGGVQPQVFRGEGARALDGGTVRFLGRVGDAELEALYAGAGVLVAPSRYEGFGIPIVEAGRLGCPSVYATGSAMTEVAGEGGLGFDPDDMNRCVELVRRVLGDANLRAELAARTRRNAAPYTWRRSAALIFAPAGPEVVDGGPGIGGSDLGSHRTEQGLRVLHVTESFAAGTGLAIVDFARGAQRQGVVSFLLGQDRGGGLLDEVEASSPFRTAKIVKPGILRLWREIGPAVRETRPDVVHAHSSLAGAVVRLRLMGSRTAVVYSPHCFAFERRDISRPGRHLYRLAEVILARWTAGFVCVSPHEADLARGLRRRANVKYVINYIEPAPPDAPDGSPGTEAVLRLVSVGRIVRQKDPAMFAEVVDAVQAAGAVVEAVWIGDGDDEAARRALLEAGVHVTGWVRSSRVRELLATHHYYVHTASWEALPIAVLDAMSAGLAVLVRRNKAYAGLLPEEWLFDDVAGALRMLERLRDPSYRRQRLLEQSHTLAALRRRGPDVVLAADYEDIHDSWLSRRSSRRLGSRRKEP